MDDAVNVAALAFGGSNPSLPTILFLIRADVAQSVEHLHGKEGVVGSNPTIGSK